MKMGIKFLIINFILLTSFLFVYSNREKPWENLKFPPLKKISQPNIDVSTLKNGMKVFLLKDATLPEVKVVVYIKAGDVASPENKYGLATVTFDLLRNGGNKKYTSDKFDEVIDSLGASIEVNVGKDKSEIYGNFLSEDFKKGLELISYMLLNPTFEEDKIEVEKNRIKGLISRRNDDPSQVATREFKKVIYGKNKLTREIEYSDLNNINRNDLVNFYNNYVVPGNIYIGVYGDFDTEEVKNDLKSLFGSWNKKGEKEEIPTVKSNDKKGVFLIDKPDVNQSNIRIGHLGILKNNPDYAAILVMDNILGTNSFSSRLMQRIRTNKGLAYSVGGGIFSNFEYPGVFMVYCGTKTSSTIDAISSILEEIKKIRMDNVSEKELEDAKKSFLNSFVFEFANGFDYLRREMELDFWGYPMDFYTKLFDKIKDVKISDVNRVAKKYIHLDDLKIVVVGKGDKLQKPLEKFGKVTKVDISIPLPKTKILSANDENLKKGKSILSDLFVSLGFVGQKVWGYMESVKGEIYQNNASVANISMTSYKVFPDRAFIDTRFPMGEMRTILVNNKGYTEFMGKRKNLSKEEIKDLLDSIKKDPIFISTLTPEKDFKVWYTGKRNFLNKKFDSIRVLFKDGEFLDFFFSGGKNEKILEGISYIEESPKTGKVLVDKKINNFKVMDNIKIPSKFEVFKNGEKVGEFEVVEFEINPKKLPIEIRK